VSDERDIVDVLRDGTEGAGWSCDFSQEHDAINEAADEIAKLRTELRRMQRLYMEAVEGDTDCEELCQVLCAGPCRGEAS
jgi:hypothetical protein